jgi:PAS domain S-box-containing protein
MPPTLLDAIPDGLVVLDDAGRIVSMNTAASEMSGIEPQAALGRCLDAVAVGGGIDWTDLVDRIQAGQTGELLLTASGNRPLLALVRHVSSADGGNPLTLVVMRDLAVIDHQRWLANASQRRQAFRFVSQSKLRPDLTRQRQISADLDRRLTLAERAVVQGARVLITGESGVGKTEIARHLHHFISDDAAPFVHINCGSIPETLFESELFGYERGAFTGALHSGRKGLIEQAEGGTLFLDEVGEIPLSMQAKLLKFLESGTVQRVGGSSERSVRVRVISATNRDLDAMAADGQFRRDLYYRLAVVPVHIMPLRESRELIDEIVDYFLTATNQRRPKSLTLSASCRERLKAYRFPGNIRELHNIIQQLSVVADTVAEARDLPPTVLAIDSQGANGGDGGPGRSFDLKAQVRVYERQIIEHAIARYGSKRRAAEALGVDIGTVVRKTQTKHREVEGSQCDETSEGLTRFRRRKGRRQSAGRGVSESRPSTREA